MPHSACHNPLMTATYFADDDGRWTDVAMASWLACLFEHNGDLAVGARRVVLTLHGRDASVLQSLQKRFGGQGEKTDRLDRRHTASWRVSRPQELTRLLRVMWPYLTITRETVRNALDALDRIKTSEQEREQRDREIVALWIEGRSKNAIARALDVPYPVVTKAIECWKRGPWAPQD